jgi:hypothetical protein
MKKLILILVFTAFHLSSYSQSLTFNDVLHVFKHQDPEVFLKTKHFDKQPKDGRLVYYSNKSSLTKERFNYDPRGVSYETYDAKYLETFVAEIKKQYPQLIMDDDKISRFYQFGNINTNIMLHISKKPNTYSTVSVGRR